MGTANNAIQTLKLLSLSRFADEKMARLVKQNKGRVVVLDLWSTSCEPCVREFPHLVELQGKHGEDEIGEELLGRPNGPRFAKLCSPHSLLGIGGDITDL